jgi:hypothetical protein
VATTYWTQSGTGTGYTTGTASGGNVVGSTAIPWSGTFRLEGAPATLSIGTTVSVYMGSTYMFWGYYQGFVTIAGVDYPVLNNGTTYYIVGTNTALGSYPLNASIICYLAGTMILTDRGEVAVESLAPGDLVATRFGGLRPVRWIGRQSFDGRLLGHRNAPVCFRAGSLGDGRPFRDLWVSPDHSMVVDDHLVPARLLVNGVTVTQAPFRGRVEYLHVDLGVHDLVLADGAWSESYAEQENRQNFHNHGEFAAAYPRHVPEFHAMCLPQVGGEDPRLPGLRARVMAQVAPAGFIADPGLHLLADGRRLVPLPDGTGVRFRVPAGTRTLHLCSRTARPALFGLSDDDRSLGYRVTGMALHPDLGAARIVAPADMAGAGWHAPDADGARWTGGHADLGALLAMVPSGAFWIGIAGHGMPRYLAPEQPRALAA